MTLQIWKYITNTKMKYQKTQAKKIIHDHGQAIGSSNVLPTITTEKDYRSPQPIFRASELSKTETMNLPTILWK